VKKFIFIGVLGALLVIGVVFFVSSTPLKKLSDEERVKALAKILGRKPNLGEKNKPVGDTIYNGKYVSFAYPRAAKIYTLRPPDREKDKSYLEDFIYDLDSPRLAFFMETVVSGVKSVEDFPSVRLRDMAKGQYSREDIEAGGREGVSFEKTDGGVEKTVFFNFDGKIISFSVQGSDIKEVRSLFEKTISSLHFL
jgi:hypothetical protein